MPATYALYLPIDMRILLLFFICLVMSSCFTQGDCLVSATNQMRIIFKKKKTTTDTAVTITYVEISGTDTLLSDSAATSDFLLPLNGKVDTTRFIIHRIKAGDPTVTGTDTLTVKYDIQGSVATPDCDAYTYYQNLRVIRFNRGDSLLKIYDRNLAKDPSSQVYAINFWIYF